MALVRVTGDATDFAGMVIDAALQPRLFFRPLRSDVLGGLRIGVSTQADFNLTSGAFGADLEGDTEYEPWMDWLRPGRAGRPPADRAASRARWPVFNSGSGGPISALFPPLPNGRITAELAPPPDNAEGIIWIDLTNVTSGGALVYRPGGN